MGHPLSNILLPCLWDESKPLDYNYLFSWHLFYQVKWPIILETRTPLDIVLVLDTLVLDTVLVVDTLAPMEGTARDTASFPLIT